MKAPRPRTTKGKTPPLRCACLTMAKNESTLMLPWARYHGALFGYDNLYVFDNGSTEPGMLQALDAIQALGVHVDRNHNDPIHFANKGAVLGATMAELRDSGAFDFLIPLDCDEFFAVQEGDTVQFEPAHILARLAELLPETRVPNVRFNYLNVLGHKDQFLKAHYLKTFLQARGFLDLDHGFHLGRSSLSTDAIDTDFVYIHCHAKPYEVLIRHSREKLAFWCDVNDPDALLALEAANGPGWHLVRYLRMTEREYVAMFQTDEGIALPGFAQQLEKVGADTSFLLGHLPVTRTDLPSKTSAGIVYHPASPARPSGKGIIVLGAPSPHLGPVINALASAGVAIDDPANFFMDRRWLAGLASGAIDQVKHWLLIRAAAAGPWATWLPNAAALSPVAIEALRWPRVIQIGQDMAEPAALAERLRLTEAGVAVMEIVTPVALAEPFLLAEALVGFLSIEPAPDRIAQMVTSMALQGLDTRYEGWIDRADETAITGWCWMKGSGFRPTIELFVDGIKRAASVANLPRGDLAEAGKGDGCFAFSLPIHDLQLSSHARIDILVAASGYRLSNSGKLLKNFRPDHT